MSETEGEASQQARPVKPQTPFHWWEAQATNPFSQAAVEMVHKAAGRAADGDEGTALYAPEQHARAPAQLVKGQRAPLWAKGGPSPNPGGRPKGASPRAALLRELAANPDADGIGAKSVELARSIIDKALELGRAHAVEGDDARILQSKAKALDSLLATLAEVEPNVRKVEQTTTSQRVVLNLAGAAPAQPRAIDAAPVSESAPGPIQAGTMQRDIPPLVEPQLPPASSAAPPPSVEPRLPPAASPALPASPASSSPSPAVEERPHPLGP